MTIEEIQTQIGKISASRFDDEVAHCLEDDLRADFIKYISDGGSEDIQEKAELVSSTSDIKFRRWCA